MNEISNLPRANRGGNWLAVLFGLLGGLGFGIPLYLFFVIPYLEIQSAQSWRQQSCLILRSETKRGDLVDDGLEFKTFYSYTDGGVEYRNERFSFLSERVGLIYTHKYLYQLEKTYQVGASAACFVNPDDPREAVLNRDCPNAFLYLGFGIFALSTLCFLFCFFALKSILLAKS